MAEGSYIVWLVPACNCDIATYTRANDPPTATDPGLGAGLGGSSRRPDWPSSVLWPKAATSSGLYPHVIAI